MTIIKTSSLRFLFFLLLPLHGSEGFSVPSTPFFVAKTKRSSTTVLWDLKSDVLGAASSAAKSLAKQATDKINELTGKEEYEFGDLSKLLDQKARAAVADMTDKEEADLGDLIQLAQDKVAELVGKVETNQEWKQLQELSQKISPRLQEGLAGFLEDQPNDLSQIKEVATREIVSIIQSREYGLGDVFYLLRLCTSFGLGMNPAVMAIFPLNVLIQLYNLSLIQEGGKGVAAAVALELDKRARNAFALKLDEEAKLALFGEKDVEVGAIFKKAVLDNLGTTEYNFGDLVRNVLDSESPQPIGGNIEELEGDLEALDKALEMEGDPEALGEDVELLMGDLEALDEAVEQDGEQETSDKDSENA